MEKAGEFIRALHLAGLIDGKENISTDQIDQLFLNRSTGMILEAVTAWIKNDCPSHEDRELYEKLVQLNIHRLPEPEDVEDVMEDIKEQERLLELYSGGLARVKEEIDELQCQVESSTPAKPKSSQVSQFHDLRKSIQALRSSLLPDESFKEFRVGEIFSEMGKILDNLVETIESMQSFLQNTALPKNHNVPGAEFDLIPEIDFILNEPSSAWLTWHEALASKKKDIAHDQQELKHLRDRLLDRFESDAAKVIMEALACLQLFTMVTQLYRSDIDCIIRDVNLTIDYIEDQFRPDFAPIPTDPVPFQRDSSRTEQIGKGLMRSAEMKEAMKTMEYLRPCLDHNTMLPEVIALKMRQLERLIRDCSGAVMEASKLVHLTKLQEQCKKAFLEKTAQN